MSILRVLRCEARGNEFRHYDYEDYEGKEFNIPANCPDCRSKQRKTNICKAGLYRTNGVITHGPLACYGGFGVPECQYLADCIKEVKSQGLKVRRKRMISHA